MKKVFLSLGFALFSVTAVVVRIVELVKMIDETKGFYYERFETISLIINIGLFLGCALFALFSILVLRKSKSFDIPKNPFILGIAALIASLGIFADAGEFFSSNLVTKPADLAVCILSVLSALVLLGLGFGFFFNKKLPPILTVVPIVWSVARLVLTYTHFNGIALVSENILDILAMCFFMIFWLYHAKFLNKINTKQSIYRLFVFGIPASLLGFLCTVPRFFAEYSSRENLLSHSPLVSFANLAFAVYIVTFMGVILFQKKKDVTPAASQLNLSENEMEIETQREEKTNDETDSVQQIRFITTVSNQEESSSPPQTKPDEYNIDTILGEYNKE